MIVWLNGTFGAGKTTTARELLPLLPDSRIFDSEQVGFMLRHALATEPVSDFQHWPPWRALVVETAGQLLDHVGGTLVIPQTVLVEAYWQQIHDGLTAAGIPVHAFVLHTGRADLTTRIDGDRTETGARGWRLDHLDAYEQAVPWLHRAADVVTTTGRNPADVARDIAARVTARTAPAETVRPKPSGPGAAV